jgi:16S rRNA (adenine1518-N6/adenine1519-N6)-dimethyltransferase
MTSPKKIMQKKGLHPLKRLSQSFLTDKNIVAAIVEAADIRPDDTVLEIGPGMGTLTGLIVQRAREVIAVELDPYMADILEETFPERRNLKVVRADILAYDLTDALPGLPSGKLNVIGNVPYNISTPILFHLLTYRRLIRTITIMLQKEVAERLGAPPGTKTYGIPSVAVAMFARVTDVVDVPPTSFYPRPKVTSRVIRLDIRERPLVELRNEAFFSRVVKTAFAQRRKTLFNNLKSFVPSGGDADLSAALAKSGIDGGRRAETLTVEEFGLLSNVLAGIFPEPPENH